eukprot:g26153.t1
MVRILIWFTVLIYACLATVSANVCEDPQLARTTLLLQRHEPEVTKLHAPPEPEQVGIQDFKSFWCCVVPI